MHANIKFKWWFIGPPGLPARSEKEHRGCFFLEPELSGGHPLYARCVGPSFMQWKGAASVGLFEGIGHRVVGGLPVFSR